MRTQLPTPKGAQPLQFSAHIYCGQRAAWIKVPLGMEVGLGLRDIVLDGDPAPPPLNGGGAGSPIFGQCPLWPNGWMDSDANWYGDRPWPRRLCVRWEPRSPSPKRGRSPQIFDQCLWPNGWMDQDGTWHGRRPQTRRLCVRWGLSPLPKKGAEPLSPIFGPCLLRPNGCMDQDATFNLSHCAKTK